MVGNHGVEPCNYRLIRTASSPAESLPIAEVGGLDPQSLRTQSLSKRWPPLAASASIAEHGGPDPLPLRAHSISNRGPPPWRLHVPERTASRQPQGAPAADRSSGRRPAGQKVSRKNLGLARKVRDLNPGGPLNPYTVSNRAPRASGHPPWAGRVGFGPTTACWGGARLADESRTATPGHLTMSGGRGQANPRVRADPHGRDLPASLRAPLRIRTENLRDLNAAPLPGWTTTA